MHPHYTTLHYTTLHCTILHYRDTTLHYTTTLNYTTLYYQHHTSCTIHYSDYTHRKSCTYSYMYLYAQCTICMKLINFLHWFLHTKEKPLAAVSATAKWPMTSTRVPVSHSGTIRVVSNLQGLYHATQTMVWVPKVPPGPLPVMWHAGSDTHTHTHTHTYTHTHTHTHTHFKCWML